MFLCGYLPPSWVSIFPLESKGTQSVEPAELTIQTVSVHFRVCNHHAFLLDFQMTRFWEQGMFCSLVSMLATNFKHSVYQTVLHNSCNRRSCVAKDWGSRTFFPAIRVTPQKGKQIAKQNSSLTQLCCFSSPSTCLAISWSLWWSIHRSEQLWSLKPNFVSMCVCSCLIYALHHTIL